MQPLLGTLGDVLPTIQAHLCGKEIEAKLPIPHATTYCVVLVDGLGFHNLQSVAKQAPFLTDHLQGPLRSAIPSTTATNVSYFGTGLAGGRTGMLGYTVQNPATKRIMNLISWNGAPDPATWQKEPPIFEQLSHAGITSVSVGPWVFEGSGLTEAALRGSEYEAAETLEERVRTAAEVAAEPDVQLVYMYWGEVDATGHHYGPNSAQWREEVVRIDRALYSLRQQLPPQVPLIITADHGMVDIPDENSNVFPGPSRIDIAEHMELQRNISNVAGEPRFLHLHTEPGTAEPVASAWQNFLGERAQVFLRDDAIKQGMFGHVAQRNLEVIGDVVVAMLGDVTVGDSRFQSPTALGLRGMHGSVTDLECTVPLIVA